MTVNAHIIGCAKCGTTSLAHILSAHPDVNLAPGKEVHFFDSDESFKLGFEYYHSLANVSDHLMNIDATPGYIRKEKYIRRLSDYLQDTSQQPKIIVMVRDPIQRAVSHYQHRFRTGHEVREFTVCIEQLLERPRDSELWDDYLADGEYQRLMSILFKYFKRDDILVLGLNELKHTPEVVLKKTLSFLQLKPQLDLLSKASDDIQNVNSAAKSLLFARFIAQESALKTLLKKYLKPHQSLKLRFFLTKLNRSSKRKPQKINMDSMPELRDQMLNHYEKDIQYITESFGNIL